MITLKLNEIPGYTIDGGGYVTIVFVNGFTWPTGYSMEQLGLVENEKEKEPRQANKVTEETLLSVVAMFVDKQKIPR